MAQFVLFKRAESYFPINKVPLPWIKRLILGSIICPLLINSTEFAYDLKIYWLSIILVLFSVTIFLLLMVYTDKLITNYKLDHSIASAIIIVGILITLVMSAYVNAT